MENNEVLEGVKRVIKDIVTLDTIGYQIVPIKISNAGQVVRINAETKKEHKTIKGIFGSASSDFGIINSTLQLTIDDKEVLPENFEASLINRQVGVNINELPYKIVRKARNSKITGTYTDGSNQNTKYPYTYNLYLVAIAD